MAWGKEEFRTKYKESNDCFEKIIDNYYDLDQEYQIISKQLQQKENIIKEVREYIEKHTSEPKTSVYGLPKLKVFNGDVYELLEILDKEDKNGDNK